MITRFRHESPVQFIQTMRELMAHTIRYMGRMPKSERFTWTLPLIELCRNTLHSLVEANSLDVLEYREERKSVFSKAIGKMDALEEELSALAFDPAWFALVNGDSKDCYPFVRWGELIDSERRLLRKVMASDENRVEGK